MVYALKEIGEYHKRPSTILKQMQPLELVGDSGVPFYVKLKPYIEKVMDKNYADLMQWRALKKAELNKSYSLLDYAGF